VLAIVYGAYIHHPLSLIVGFNRVNQGIEEFPYSCAPIRHAQLEGCEHIWLDHKTKKLYAACSTLESRIGWSPGGNKYNASARSGTDHISVLDIDQPGADGMYGMDQLDFVGSFGGEIDLHGFDAKEVNGRLRFWFINHRPPVNESTGDLLAAEEIGANSTVEIFDLDEPTNTLHHVKTIFNEAIITPNSLAVDEDGIGFVITNDHARKVGPFRLLENIWGTGSITYCQSDSGKCEIVGEKGFSFPNGIVRGHDGLFYVAHSSTGAVTVHSLSNGTFTKVGEIITHFPIDNLSVDAAGSILVAAFPSPLRLGAAMESPRTINSPAAVLSITKREGNSVDTAEASVRGGYDITKILEDGEGKVLPTTTIVVHDVESRRLILSGVTSPFIGICHRTD
jgi:hypothetical protein